MQSSKCAAFWNHTNIRNDNRIFPCCRFKHHIAEFDGDVQQILFHEKYQELRNKSLSNEPITGCEKCYYEESLGKESLRQRFNKEYDIDSVSLKYLEIGFDNICNLTCDGCWEDFSSEWAKKKGLDKTIIVKSTTEIKTIPSTINKILFLGGEPLMTSRHYKFLKMIEDPSLVDVIYNTNGTFLLKDIEIELFKKFKSIKFILSIDGYADLNNQVRSGSSWEDILKFISQIKQNNFNLEINTVLHKNNWHGIKDLELFIQELNVPWTVNILTYPFNLDIKHIDEKEKLVELLRSIKIVDLEYIIKHVSDTDL